MALIKINRDTVIQLNLYTEQSCSQDLVEPFCNACFISGGWPTNKPEEPVEKLGAEEIIKTLGDHWNALFLQELVKAANKKLEEADPQYSFDIKEKES